MKRNTRIVSAALAAIPIVILGASALCSWAIGDGASARWRLAFRLLCHGLEERSLSLFGATMPICARCTGIYAGLLAGLLIYLLWSLVAASPTMRTWHLMILVSPLAIDGITQASGLRESTNLLRISTGLLAGAAFAFWVAAEVEHQETHAFTSP